MVCTVPQNLMRNSCQHPSVTGCKDTASSMGDELQGWAQIHLWLATTIQASAATWDQGLPWWSPPRDNQEQWDAEENDRHAENCQDDRPAKFCESQQTRISIEVISFVKAKGLCPRVTRPACQSRLSCSLPYAVEAVGGVECHGGLLHMLANCEHVAGGVIGNLMTNLRKGVRVPRLN